MPGRPARQPSKARPWRLCAMNLDELESVASLKDNTSLKELKCAAAFTPRSPHVSAH